MSQNYKLLGWRPDADPTTPGVITECWNMIPTHRGMRTMPGMKEMSGQTGDVPDAEVCAAKAFKTNFVTLVLVGTQQKLFLWHNIPSEWIDVSGATYSSLNFWIFASFGKYLLAVGDQGYPGLLSLNTETYPIGTFSPVSGSPAWRLIDSVNRFAMGFGTNIDPDRWGCSARDNHLDWTPDVATLCATGRLVDDYGSIVASCALGPDMLAFKKKSVYLGTFVGAPEVWQWRRLQFEDGCLGPNAVCKAGGTVAFLSASNLYMMNGATPVPVMDGEVREYYLAHVNAVVNFPDQLSIAYDDVLGIIFVQVWPTFELMAYHIATGKWGLIGRFDTVFFSCPNPFHNNESTLASIDVASRKVMLATSDPSVVTPASMTTWDIGDIESAVELKGARVNWVRRPDFGQLVLTATPYKREMLGTALVAGSPVPETSDGKYEIRQSARWHRIRFDANQEVEATSIFVDVAGAGNRK